MNRTRSRLLRFLIEHGPASCADAAAALKLSKSTVRRQITLLCGAGMVRPAAGVFSAQREQIEKHLQELYARFQSPIFDLRNSTNEASHLALAAFHSSECPCTSKETS